MKYKYTGPDGQKSMELIIFKIMPKDEELKNGMIIEVPDDNQRLITGLDVHGLFERITEKPKKTIKKSGGD